MKCRKTTGSKQNFPKSPSHVYNPVPSNRRPDIDLLRSKLIIACHSVVREDIAKKPLRNEREIRNAQWITTHPVDRARFFVLDGVTFKLRQYGTSWEAKLLASENPPLEAGNGVVIYLNDHVDDLFKSFVPMFLERVGGSVHDDLARNSLNETVVREERERLGRLKRELGLTPDAPDGSALFLHLFRAVIQIRAGMA